MTHQTSNTERIVWNNIKQRCYNPNHKNYKDYGGRGITICDEWRNNFDAFYEYIGSRPTPEHSFDRIDNDGNYEPGNVKWSTKTEQIHNRRPLDTVSGYPGIEPKGNKWQALMYVGTKRIYLGRYDTMEEAIRVRQQAEVQYIGKTRNGNPVDESFYTDDTEEILAIMSRNKYNRYLSALEITKWHEDKLKADKAAAVQAARVDELRVCSDLRNITKREKRNDWLNARRTQLQGGKSDD